MFSFGFDGYGCGYCFPVCGCQVGFWLVDLKCVGCFVLGHVGVPSLRFGQLLLFPLEIFVEVRMFSVVHVVCYDVAVWYSFVCAGVLVGYTFGSMLPRATGISILQRVTKSNID